MASNNKGWLQRGVAAIGNETRASGSGKQWVLHERGGSCGLDIKGENKEGRCIGTSLMPGDASDQSTFRSKLTGLYGIFLHLKYMAEGWQEEGLQIMVVCNGKSAVDQLNSRKPIKPLEVHYDLLLAIQEL